MNSSNSNNLDPKFRHRYHLENVDIFDGGSHIVIKHKDSTCRQGGLLDALQKKRLRIQSKGVYTFTNLKIEPYREEAILQSPNTVKISFASAPQNLSATEANKNLLKLVYQFLSKRKYATTPAFFSNPNANIPKNDDIQATQADRFWQQVEKQLQEIEREITQLISEQNSIVMRMQKVTQKMTVKQKLKYPDINMLNNVIQETLVSLFNALKNASSDYLLNSFLEAEIEGFRYQLAALTERESGEVSSQEVLTHFGEAHIGQHLLNAKEQFIANQANEIRIIRLKLQWLESLETKEKNLHLLVQSLEIDHANLSAHLNSIEQKIMAKMDEKKLLLAQVSFYQFKPQSQTIGSSDTEVVENNNNLRHAS